MSNLNQNFSAAEKEVLVVIRDFFSVFDNRNGVEPNWELLQSICSHDVRILKCDEQKEYIDDFDSFVSPRKAIFESGELRDFFETLLESKIEIFGRIAQAFVTYQKQGIYQNKPLIGKGKKSIQLINQSGKWKIHSITWFDETDDFQIDCQ